jgi:hypothetical protein
MKETVCAIGCNNLIRSVFYNFLNTSLLHHTNKKYYVITTSAFGKSGLNLPKQAFMVTF